MARIRTIKPEFWASEQVMECSPITRLLFIGLWNFCDDGGNHVDSERTIKAEIFPGDDIPSSDVRRMLDELSSNGLITFYASNGKGFLHVTGWKHQKIERPSFKHPPFSEGVSTNDRRTIDDNSPPEGKGREGKGEEGKEQSSLRSDSSSPTADDAPAEQPAGVDLTLTPPVDLGEHKAERLRQVTDDAIAAFNAKLGKPHGLLPSVHASVGREKRQAQVKRCTRVARQICEQQFGAKTITREFWDAYWAEVDGDPFRSGRQTPGKGHENWTPSFEYLTREEVMLAVFDRAMSAQAGAA